VAGNWAEPRWATTTTTRERGAQATSELPSHVNQAGQEAGGERQHAGVPLGRVRAGEVRDASYFRQVVGDRVRACQVLVDLAGEERFRQRMMSSLDRPCWVRRST
jgi:hypothetical protein